MSSDSMSRGSLILLVFLRDILNRKRCSRLRSRACSRLALHPWHRWMDGRAILGCTLGSSYGVISGLIRQLWKCGISAQSSAMD